MTLCFSISIIRGAQNVHILNLSALSLGCKLKARPRQDHTSPFKGEIMPVGWGDLRPINVETRLPRQAITAKHIWICRQRAPASCPRGSLCAEETADLDHRSVSLCHP